MDQSNRDTVARLLRFTTTNSTAETQDVSLDEYISRMKEGQDKIYYLTADTYVAAKSSPLLEIFRKKGIEVLLLSDVVDNWVVGSLTEYQGKQLQSVAKGEVDLTKLEDEQEKEQYEKTATEYKELTERIKTALSEKVKEVRVTNRLTTSPACLVADEFGLDASFERILKAAGPKLPSSKPIFEINPQHAIINRMRDEADQARFDDWSAILFDQAVLSDGGQLEDPMGYVTRLNELLVSLSGK